MLEEVDTDTLSDLPLAVNLRAHSYNGPNRFVRWYDRAWRFVYSLKDLIVRVAKTSRANSDENVFSPDFRDWDFAYLVLGVKLWRTQPSIASLVLAERWD